MQCSLRGMGEIEGASTRATRTPASDTLPKPGRVNEVCKEWLVHEDGALAYQLQKEEVDQHYTGNKSRNAIIREDLPKARHEQKIEEEEALAKYHQMIFLQEEKDAKIAMQLAEKIEREEAEKKYRLELNDQEIARQIQEREKLSVNRAHALVAVGDINSVGLPCADISEPKLINQLRGIKLKESSSGLVCSANLTKPLLIKSGHGVVYKVEKEEEFRKFQELKDEELAKTLQEQENNFEPIDQLDKDRLIAIEAQDQELARLLQERVCM
uniref:Coiled-coil domain-containing protein n=1 Tax=Clastoptera arizonana TaxID=38151 RepID=A0A1B6E2B7_9HEMI